MKGYRIWKTGLFCAILGDLRKFTKHDSGVILEVYK